MTAAKHVAAEFTSGSMKYPVKASVFLPSYNKGEYALEAIESVLAQTLEGWELWLLENSSDNLTRELIKNSGLLKDRRIRYHEIDFSDEDRRSFYPTTRLMNTYYPKGNGEYFFYLSDDDLLKPECLEVCTQFLDAHPEYDVCYFGLEITTVNAPRTPPDEVLDPLIASCIRSYGEVDCMVDGGQVVHRASCLDVMDKPYFSESINPFEARHSDGTFLNSLVRRWALHPVREPEVLATHRYTKISIWTRYAPGVGLISR